MTKHIIKHEQDKTPYYWAGAGWHMNPSKAVMFDSQDEAQAELDGAHSLMTAETIELSQIVEHEPEASAE